jgi:hypothetical protein
VAAWQPLRVTCVLGVAHVDDRPWAAGDAVPVASYVLGHRHLHDACGVPTVLDVPRTVPRAFVAVAGTTIDWGAMQWADVLMPETL